MELLNDPATNSPTTDIFKFTSGPRNASIILIGEAWGSEESTAQKPFVGSSGKELTRILADAGLSRDQVLCTNVIHARPAGNDFTNFLHPISARSPVKYHGTSPKPELLAGLAELDTLIDLVKPKLIICAGNWPLFALGEVSEVKTTAGFKLPTGVAKWRGSMLTSREIAGRCYPLLPIIHPAAILREWGWRNVTVHDLRTRATRFLNGKTNWTREAEVSYHKPNWPQVELFIHNTLRALQAGPHWLSVDLETYRRKWISVVGLADDRTALAIPLFYVNGETTHNYWPIEKEQIIWENLKLILEHPNVRIIGQNFIYDTQWFHRLYGIQAQVSFDTMVAHHLLFPGTPKALDYLASLYCNHYSYWKDESGDWDNFPADAERYWKYNCKDIRATYEIAQVLRKVFDKDYRLAGLYAERMEQWTLSRKMMLKGTLFDSALQKAMRLQLFEEANQISEWLLNAVPETLQYTSTGKPWYDSPKGTARLLYEVLGLPVQLHKKTKQPTADAEALAALRGSAKAAWLSPLLERLEHLRSLGVFISHFLDAKISPDGRIRCTFNIAHPETFRWSSNSNGFGEGTNLQNIPKGD